MIKIDDKKPFNLFDITEQIENILEGRIMTEKMLKIPVEFPGVSISGNIIQWDLPLPLDQVCCLDLRDALKGYKERTDKKLKLLEAGEVEKAANVDLYAHRNKEFGTFSKAIYGCRGIDCTQPLEITFIKNKFFGLESGTCRMELYIDNKCAKEIFKSLRNCFERTKRLP